MLGHTQTVRQPPAQQQRQVSLEAAQQQPSSSPAVYSSNPAVYSSSPGAVSCCAVVRTFAASEIGDCLAGSVPCRAGPGLPAPRPVQNHVICMQHLPTVKT